MSFAVRRAWDEDLDRLVELAVECQADPARSCPYLSSDADAVRSEVLEIEGPIHWTDATWVALDDERGIIGWVAAEYDAEMCRVWWFGPFVAGVVSELTDAVLDAPVRRRQTRWLGDFDQHELAADEVGPAPLDLPSAHGFVAAEGSAALRLADLDVAVPAVDAAIEPAGSKDEAAVELHDEIFPATHATGEYLFGLVEDRHDRFVARAGGELVGYVATELQHDGSLYVDYLGVVECRTATRGSAAASVAARHTSPSRCRFYAHLTVRVSNEAARRLYASLGFVEDVVLVPLPNGIHPRLTHSFS